MSHSHCRNRLATGNIKEVSIAETTQPDLKSFDRKQQSGSIFSAIDRIWQFFLTAAGVEELRIWQTSDDDGNTWWHGCDRVTGRSICGATDDEMRAWLDRRYCQ